MNRINHDELSSAWSPGQPPATLDRSGRVKLLGEFARAALSGREPSRSSLLFIGGAIEAWLINGGSLERDYLRVTAQAGSHHTPAFVWQQLSDDSSSRGAQDLDDEATISPTSTEGES